MAERWSHRRVEGAGGRRPDDATARPTVREDGQHVDATDAPGIPEANGQGSDDRGVSPVVAKSLELGILVLFVALVTTTLFGGLVPDSRAATGAELADRTLAAAGGELAAAVPPEATVGTVVVPVELPPTIHGEGYEIVGEDRTLVLRHDHPAIGGRYAPPLPAAIESIEGSWSSGGDPVVVADRDPEGTELRLEER